MADNYNQTGLEVAVIGLAGAFPGADDIDQLWENLKKGIESIITFNEDELLEAGVDADMLKEPEYIKSMGHFQEKDCFDAALFGYTPAEAAVMDPQLRLFHQCVWSALEHAGYNPEAGDEDIGLYAGASSSFNWEALTMLAGDNAAFGGFEFSQYSCKDFLSTRIAYKFNFHGPAVTLHTACSTSLVAIDMACRSLLTGQCRMAVAGGVTITIPYKSGYIWQEGMIYSNDGHCRAFDADASGTVGGEGAGAVVLELLEDALERRDTIHAVIKGTALNNDGNRKVGFSAPSIGGQSDVIKTAYLMAEVEPETIGYIEAHGTGTALGDPIEIQALTKAFDTEKKGFCAVGALKTNVGHLDSAAGVAGFIKTVLVLKHKQIPPTLHFKNPNQAIDFENSPFYVNNELKEFDVSDHPRRAAVSSFGIGGTNAHAILEEGDLYNKLEESTSHRHYHIIPLSAQTTEALDTMTENLATFFSLHQDTNIVDATFTLQMGRRHMRRRRVLVCNGVADAATALSPEGPRVRTADAGSQELLCVFMFSGQGSQYVNMGKELYLSEPLFRQMIDDGFSILNGILDLDASQFLYPASSDQSSLEEAKGMLDHVLYSGPVKLVFEYALAKLLMRWGVEPAAMIGHSFGEYAVAALAGVMTLNDALKMAVWRGQLMEETPDGAMLSVPLSEDDVLLQLNKYPDVSLAAVNGPNLSIVSGPRASVENFETELQKEGIDSLRVNFPRASHSGLMKEVSGTFRDKISKFITLNAPTIPYISGLSGTWIKDAEATDPGYWARHLEEPIRFYNGLTELLGPKNHLFIQVGSDRGLPLFLDGHPQKKDSTVCINILKHPKEPSEELQYFFNRVADIWLNGGVIDWFSFHGDNPRRRIPLPTYPFAKQRFEIKGDPFVMGSLMLEQEQIIQKKEEIDDWFYFPGWQQSVLPKPQTSPRDKKWLIFANSGDSFPSKLVEELKAQKASVAVVNRGGSYTEDTNRLEFMVDPKETIHYDHLFESLANLGFSPEKIVHLWNINGESVESFSASINLESVTSSQERGLFSLIGIVQALGRQLVNRDIDIEFVTDGLFEVTDQEPFLDPLKSTALGAIKIIPLEYPTIHCRCVDIIHPGTNSNDEAKLLKLMLNEFLSPIDNQVVALRGSYRWGQSFCPERLPQPSPQHPQLRERGVYLILGGFGGMGFSIAGHLAERYKARLALVGRRGLPPRDAWDRYLEEHDSEDAICKKIRKVRDMESHGADVLCFSEDIADERAMKTLLDEVRLRLGSINGVIHAAGVIDYDGIIQNRTHEQIRKNIASKVEGTLILDKLLEGETLDFLALFSSMGDVLFEEKFGEVGYGAANEFMDAFSYYKRRKDGTYAFTINWNDWKETGMALVAVDHKIPGQKTAEDYERILYGGVSQKEGVEVFLRALEHGLPRVAVWTSDLLFHLEQQKKREGKAETFYQPLEDEAATDTPPIDNRPDLSVPYEAPQTATQDKLAKIWEQFFGIRPIGIHDNFFELGGHSLRAISMVASIHKELNVKIPLNIIFASPTIAELADAVGEMSTETFEEIIHIPDQELYEIPLPILGMWMRNLYQIKDRKPFNVNGEYHLGKVDPEILGRAWQELIMRHETMRTVFCSTEKGEFMKVMPFDQAKHALEVIDISRDKDKESQMPELVRELFRTMFDLEAGPVCRAILVRQSPDDSILVLTMPHILSDAWSRDVIERELMQIYDAFMNGLDLPLRPLQVQYRDFGAWYNRQMRMSKGDELKEFWHQVCTAPLPPSNLPMDFPDNRRTGSYRRLLLQDIADMFRPLSPEEQNNLFGLMISARSVKGAQYRLVLVNEIKNIIEGLGKRTDASFFAVMSALFSMYFYRTTGQADSVTGTMVSTRTHEALNGMIGYFMNTIVYRSEVDPSQSVEDFIITVGHNISDALAHREYPLERLLSELDVSLDDLGSLFLNFYKSDSLDSVITDFESRHEPVFHVYFDMDLNIGEFANGIQIECNYNRELFKKETIEKIFRDFELFVRSVGKNPEAAVGAVKF